MRNSGSEEGVSSPAPATLAPRRLDVSLFGAVQVSAGGRVLALRSQRVRALVAYLVLAEGCTAPREQVGALLWRGATPVQARNSLRQVVRQLNIALASAGFTGLNASRQALSLDAGALNVDLWNVLAEARRGMAHPVLLAARDAPRGLLAGFEDLDEGFRAWVEARRVAVRAVSLRELDAGLRLQGLSAAGRLALAQAVVNLDPANESACRAQMRAMAELGDVAGALRVYTALQQLLLDTHRMWPAQATLALRDAIRDGRYDAPPATDGLEAVRQLRVSDLDGPAPVALAQGRMGILLEAFASAGVDAEHAHLFDGFRHGLIAGLVAFREWRIIDGACEVAEPAAARYVLNATCAIALPTASLVLTLRETDGQSYVWSARRQIALADWFAAQAGVISRLIAGMKRQMNEARQAWLLALSEPPRDAHDLWLLGQALLRYHGAAQWNRARDLFEAAIAAAPGFSPAYSAVVQMHSTLHVVHPGTLRTAERQALTLQTARRAVALDPADGRALLGLGWALVQGGQTDEAAAHLRVAADLNANDVWTLLSVALFLACSGRTGDAVERAHHALALQEVPGGRLWARMGMIQLLAGDDAAACAAFERARRDTLLLAWQAASLFHLRATAQARTTAAAFLERAAAGWFGAEPPEPGAIGRWALLAVPISQSELWERLRGGMLGAGIPDGGARFPVC